VGTARSTNSSATDGHAKSEPAVSSALRRRNTAATWKKTFGFHALLVFLDRPDIAAGEALAARQRHLVDWAASRRCAELQ
jgi:hypothetical protein